MANKPCKLALEDGTVFEGVAFGAGGTAEGEVIFNTAMTGYQEVLTDPSYAGQIVTMTYPLIGNYGVNPQDIESHDGKVQVRGFVIKELSPQVSNFRAEKPLAELLASEGVIGLTGVDTRALTRHIRLAGAMNGAMSTEILDDAELLARARAVPPMKGLDLVKLVAPKAAYDWNEGYASPFAQAHRTHGERVFNVVAIDCGAKMNIFRNLVECGCRVRVVPATASADEVLQGRPDGVFVSNGPGSGGRHPHDPDAPPTHRARADLRHLLGASASCPGPGRQNVEAQVRASRRQPPGAKPGDGQGGDQTRRRARWRSPPRTTALRWMTPH